jgi:hypothetical protein
MSDGRARRRCVARSYGCSARTQKNSMGAARLPPQPALAASAAVVSRVSSSATLARALLAASTNGVSGPPVFRVLLASSTAVRESRQCGSEGGARRRRIVRYGREDNQNARARSPFPRQQFLPSFFFLRLNSFLPFSR